MLHDSNMHCVTPSAPGVRKPACRDCVLSSQCLPSVLGHDFPAHELRLRTSTLSKGQLLFEEGDRATSLYVVRSGAVSASCPNDYGMRQILSFSLRGDLVGASSLHEPEHLVTVRAVQRTALCEFPLDALHRLSSVNGGVVRFLRSALGKELHRNRQARLQLAVPRADSRVASFLAWYAGALTERRLSAARFRLPMSRVEIANHLGLAGESVSRALADLRVDGIVEARGREVEILDPRRLWEVAGSMQFRRAACPPARQLSPDTIAVC